MNRSIWGLGGHASAAPSDTMPAYWAALGAGADGLAVHVQQTSDHQLVCAPGPASSYTLDGSAPIPELSGEELATLDAGASFQSSLFDDDHRQVDVGEDRPWKRHTGGRSDAVTHPTLEQVLLHYSRRTQLLLILQSAAGREQAMATALLPLLTRFGLLDRVVLAGDAAILEELAPHPRLCLIDQPAESVESSIATCTAFDAAYWLATASRVVVAERSDVLKLVLSDPGGVAPTREQFDLLKSRPDVSGWVVSGVDRTMEMERPLGLMLADSFSGPSVDPQNWAVGHSRDNDDTSVRVSDGLTFDISGPNYSGAAAFSTFLTHGPFDARVSYEVSNPTQGTTFELAVVHIDAGYHRPNLSFDVHGAPPYASAERDEADGFRIGWNNGPALTRWVQGKPQSSNLYNNYSRNVGHAGADRPHGELRLTRFGEVFNAYYRDAANPGWVLCGSTPVPALAPSVFFRLGAKHWPKRGDPAPDNQIRLWDFELYQP